MDYTITVKVPGDVRMSLSPVPRIEVRKGKNYDAGRDAWAGTTLESLVRMAECLLARLNLQLDELDASCAFLEYLLGLSGEEPEEDEDEEYEDDEDDEDDEDSLVDRFVLTITPGAPPRLLTLGEMADGMPNYYEKFRCVEDFAGTGLNLYCREDQIMRVAGDSFLIGTGIVCREDDNAELLSLTGGEICQAIKFAREHRVTLCCDGKDVPAIRLAV